ncbi:zinc finger protein 431-like isoform X6 [Cloeon dipterum]|uniref:zinc finger protein 431-like isoform X6 n=1 Tax=Cloeon dipterum TaxID=197152 RepID=UPI00321FD66C
MAASTKVSDMCRLCGTDTLNVVRHHIFEGEGQVKKSAQKISECLPLHIAAEDPLPKNICGECSYKLDLMSDFREKAVKTDVMLVSLVEGVKPEIPDDDDDGPDHEIDNDFRSDTPVEQPEQQTEPEVLIKEEEAQQPQQPEKRPGRKAANKRPIQESDMEEEEEEAPAKKRGRKPKEKETAPAASATTSASTNPPKENTGKELVCRICLIRTTDMQAHMIANHSQNLNVKCGLCNKLFTGMATFQAHMPTHANRTEVPAKFPCDFQDCNKRFFEKEHLMLHLKHEHKIKDKRLIFDCSFCDQVYARKTNFVDHMRIKHYAMDCVVAISPAKMLSSLDGHLKCNFCPEKFSSRANLETHIMWHLRCMRQSNGIFIFGCVLCPYKSKKYRTTERHYRDSHKIDWPFFLFECDYCPMGFIHESKFVLHMDQHNGKKYNCDHCDKSFKCKDGIYRHILRKHVTENQCRFVCETCGARYYEKSKFEDHTARHSNDRPYKCLHCDYTTFREKYLVLHKKTHLAKRSKCNICKKYFLNLPGHVSASHNKREFPCQLCGKTFKRKAQCQRHLDAHLGNNYFPCDICGKVYSAAESVKKHKFDKHGIMPYECKTCKKGFAKHIELKKHRAKAHRNKTE